MIVDLISPLPRGECARRLHTAVGSEWSLLPGSPVVGVADADRLRIRKRTFYRNSFKPTLRAQLTDSDGGTRIHCDLGGTLPLLPMALGIALLVVVIAGMTIALLASRGIGLSAIPPAALIVPLAALPLFTGLGVGVVLLGRHLAKGDADYLLAFLRRTLEAN